MRFSLARTALTVLVSVAISSCTDTPISPVGKTASPTPQSSVQAAPALVISQIYGGGGNSGAQYKNDFIEIFNPGTSAVSVTGWSVQYASSAGTSWAVTALSGSIPAGGYYLVQQAAGAGAQPLLPTPDATGSITMAATAGKVALVSATTALSGSCPTGGSVVDFVAFGTSANCPPTTGTLSNSTAALRKDFGCRYTADASADFEVLAPNPRNSASPTHSCDVVVDPVPASVTVEPPTASIAATTQQAFSATARNAAGDEVGTTFEWSSDNEAVATVSAAGVATGLAEGTATITATSANGIEGSAVLTVTEAPPPPAAGDVVISQIYGGGGNAGATYTHDFIELFNRGEGPVDLDGWSVQYTSAAGTGTWIVTTLTGTIQPGRYYLVQQAAGTGGTTALPTPDRTGTILMAGTAGKVALRQSVTALVGGCPTDGDIVDLVGYGSTSCPPSTAVLSNTTAAIRNGNGCVQTRNPSVDFSVGAPNPRNSASPFNSCEAPPVSSATIVINEIMAEPLNAAGGASWGEWFEVYNYGTEAVDLQGWTIGSNGQPDHVITTSVVVPAGGYAVLGRGDDFVRNGGVNLDYNYFTGSTTTIWLDASDLLSLKDGTGALADVVSWSSGTFTGGVTRGVIDAAQDNSNAGGSNWGHSTTTFGDGDYGTPDAANGTLSSTAPDIKTITFSGRLASDPALPVGYEDQIFATLRDGSGATLPTTFTWTSETPLIASIDEDGVMHALAEGTAIVRATAADGTTRAYSLPTIVATQGGAAYANNTEFGDPVDGDASDDFIIRRPQFTTSFNGALGIPNWVAYEIDATHFGPQDRCDCFTYDPELPAAYARYTTADYTGAGAFHGYGIDRGHLARSFDRTTGSLDNATTYLFSNIIPQAADLNQGPWAQMENYLGDLARFSNKEVYIITGPAGSKGTVKNEGVITIPAQVWKVALIMPRDQGLADIDSYDDVEVIAVIAPNDAGVGSVNWQSWKTTVDAVEALSGYDLLALLPDHIETAVESNTHVPVAAVDGPYAANVGDAVAMSAAASTDADGDALTYAWSFGDGATATGVSASHAYTFAGSYTVSMIVTDVLGIADTVTTVADIADPTPPLIAATVTGTLGSNNWYTSDVAVSWTVTENESTFTTDGCTATTITSDTNGTTLTCSAENQSGFSSSESVTILRDASLPTVTWTGNSGSYAVTDAVSITCSAADVGPSGLASTTCADVNAPAYTFAVGVNTFSATATDNAGNEGSGSASFTLVVTAGALCTLTDSFTDNDEVSGSLCEKLNGLQTLNGAARRRQITSIVNQIDAQSGKAFTTDEADTLNRLVRAL